MFDYIKERENEFPISICTHNTEDYKLFTGIINQGIDAYLEGFTSSRIVHTPQDNRLHLFFHNTELQILLRRLLTLGTDNADQWATDIVGLSYGVDLWD